MHPPGRRTLVTGAGGRHGTALVRACLERGDRVIAACRNPARFPVLADLRAEFGGLEFLALDPADAASVALALPVLESITSSLDLLLIAPGELGPTHREADLARDAHFTTVSGMGLLEHYRRFAVAPVLLVRTLLPWLEKERGARVLFVSTRLGSLAGKIQGGEYSVCASAAGLHMLVRALSHDLADRGITCVVGNPDEDVTDVTDVTDADDPDVHVPNGASAAGLLSVTDGVAPARSGGFFDYTGVERAW